MPSNTFFIQCRESIAQALKNQSITIENLQQLLASKTGIMPQGLLKTLQDDLQDAADTEKQRSTQLAISLVILEQNKNLSFSWVAGSFTEFDAPRHENEKHHDIPLICDGMFLKPFLAEKYRLAFLNALCASKIRSVQFYVNSLSDDEMEALRKAILQSNIPELGISFVDTDDVNLRRVAQLLALIPHSKINSLIINASDARNLATHSDDNQSLDKWSTNLLDQFFKTLDSITHLDLTKNHVGNLPLSEVKRLAAAMTKLKVLKLTKNDLHLWLTPPDRWAVFLAALKKSSIQHLSLAYNNLGDLTVEQAQAMGEAIRDSQVETLEMQACHLNAWGEQMSVFCEAIKDSKLKKLDIRWSELNQTHMDDLFKGFGDTAIAVDASLPPKATHPVVELFKRNLKLASSCDELIETPNRFLKVFNILEMEKEYLLSKGESVEGLEDEAFFAREFERLDGYITQLNEWRSLPGSKARTQGSKQLEYAMAVFLEGMMDYDFLLEDLLTGLPATQSKTRELYGKYFDSVYIQQCDEAGLSNSTDPDIAQRIREQALLQAMRFCMDLDNNPVLFAAQEQRRFDAYLQVSCGIRDQLNPRLGQRQRNALLQLLVLNRLKQDLPQLADETPENLNRQVLLGLHDALNKKLPKLGSISDLNEQQIKECAALFHLAQDKLTRGKVNLSAVAGSLFEPAWSYTLKSGLDLQNKEHALTQLYQTINTREEVLPAFLSALRLCLNESQQLIFGSVNHSPIFDAFLLKGCNVNADSRADLTDVQRLALLQYLVVSTFKLNNRSKPGYFSSVTTPAIPSVSDLTPEAMEQLAKMEREVHRDLSRSSDGIPNEWKPVFDAIEDLHHKTSSATLAEPSHHPEPSRHP